jgi:serine/threonine-protein kinase
MPDSPISHPSDRHLAGYSLGKLSDKLLGWVAEHLEVCPECRRKVETQPPDTFMGQLRDAAPSEPRTCSTGPPSVGSNTALPRPLPGRPARRDEPPAELLAAGKYEVLCKLGEGGMGAVYKARRLLLGDVVAVKLMRQDAAITDEARERFLVEIRAVGQMRHPNIVRALDAESVGGALLLVMEYVEGVSLDRLVVKAGALPVAFACHCAAQAALGLQHAHERGLIHRDVKPGNLLYLKATKETKILDFGLARLPQEQDVRRAPTKYQTFMGTAEYVAPEQALDARSADIRSDVYGLGCTLYFLLAGQPPFRRGSVNDTLIAHLQDEPPPLGKLRPDVPEGLAAVVAKMLAKNPADRYQTPAAVAQALRPFLSGRKRSPAPRVPQEPPPLAHATQTVVRGSAAEETRPPSPAAISCALEEVAPPWRSWVGRWGWAAAAAVMLVGAALLGVLVLSKKPAPDENAATDSGKSATVNPTLKGATPEAAVAKATSPAPGPAEQKREGPRPSEPPTPPEKAAAPSFVPLFNGKDLTGWQAAQGQRRDDWKVEEEALVGRGSAYLFSERGDYEHFYLRAEAWISKGGDSGLFFRAALAPGIPQGYEAQIAGRAGKSGMSTGSLFWAPMQPAVRHEEGVEPERWFQLEVIAVGNRVVVKVNDRPTAQTTFTEPRQRRGKGHIALQAHPGTVVKFRKIEIKEIAVAPEAREVTRLDAQKERLYECLTILDGGRQLLVTGALGRNHAAMVYDPQTKQKQQVCSHVSASSPCAILASPTGRLVAMASGDPAVKVTLQVFRVSDRQAVLEYELPNLIPNIGFSHDEQRVLLWDWTQPEVHSLEVPGGKVLGRFPVVYRGPKPHASRRANAASFSPDGRLFAAGFDWGESRVWDAANGNMLARVQPGLLTRVTACAVAPDGKRLFLGDEEGTLRVRDLSTKAEVFCLRGHTAPIAALAVSADGRWALSADREGLIVLWDARSGQAVRRYVGHTGPVRTLTFSPGKGDRPRFASSSSDKTIRLWDLPG